MSDHRTIGRITTNALPAWRQAMTVTKRLYVVSSNKPGDAVGLTPNPVPTHFGDNATGSFGAGWDVMSGYSSGNLVESIGMHGTMVYATGGHTRLQNQMLGLPISNASPAHEWFEQPNYQTADVNGANLYYDPSSSVQTVGEDGATWNRAFPVRFGSWVFPRKLTDGSMGNGVPHGLRYATCAYVPPNVSGSDPLLVCILGPQGPFAQAYRPANVTDAEWFDAAWVWPSGRRKWPIHALNLRTRSWSRIGIQPDINGIGGFAASAIQVDAGSRKAWVSIDGSTALHFSLDFTAFPSTGEVAVGGVVTPAASIAPNRYSQGALTSGSPNGDLLWIWSSLSSNTALVIQNLKAGTNHTVDLSSKGLWLPIGLEKLGFSYDKDANRIIVVVPDGNPASLANGIACWELTVPPDFTNAASWTVTKTVLTTDAAVPTLTGLTMAEFYGKTRYLPWLGVCLVPFHTTMLGFRL